MIPSIVIDTNVFVSALLNPFGKSAAVLELCFQGHYEPIMGTSLFLEYEDVLDREALFTRCLLDQDERQQALNDLLSISRWVRVYYTWRPNLKDEGDNHVMELAIAPPAMAMVTHNIRDFRHADLSFPEIRTLTPAQFVQEGI
ncbi:putative toxin-antitoxin system toxin component, PIN family [Chloroflexi bacterium TSY]|nr:putative toxin-antitoxin system toxin component, PIN family [Chloroflexi bacterium TSY]